ncbi:MAG: hypothetical protein ABW128_19565 [Rhizorhabdus sp.]
MSGRHSPAEFRDRRQACQIECLESDARVWLGGADACDRLGTLGGIPPGTSLRLVAMVAIGALRLATDALNREGHARRFEDLLRENFEVLSTVV